MSDKINDGGPAFPTYGLVCDKSGHLTNVQTYDQGMSLRDWFAGVALQGLLGANVPVRGMTEDNVDQLMAKLAFRSADAMLKERTK